MITLSIGIPSKNRPISLFRCLSSIKKEDNLIYEIIVSNDSESKYQNIYQKICEKFKVKIVSGPKKGLYANHNKLYSICSGSHLRIVDDDHTFPKDHFKKCIESIRKYPEEVLSYGEAYPENLNKIFLPGELNSRGFSSIPYKIPSMNIEPNQESNFIGFLEKIKFNLAQQGLIEAITFPFVSKNKWSS